LLAYERLTDPIWATNVTPCDRKEYP